MATSVEAPVSRDAQIMVNNSITLFVRRLALVGFNGVLVLFLPRYLGAEGLGQLAFATSLAALFAAALALGSGKFLVKEIARDRASLSRYLPTALAMRLFTALPYCAVILVVTRLTGYSAQAEQVMYLAAAAAIATSFAYLMTDVLQGMENMGWPALAETASKLLLVVVGVGILVLGFGVVAYAAVVLLAAVVHFGLVAAYVGRRFPLGLRLHLPAVKGLLVGGAPFLFMAVLLDVYNEIDTVMLRFFTDDAAVGWYAAANRLYRTVDMLPMVLTTALLPTLARLHSTDTQAVVAVVKKSISVGALVIVPLALGIGLLSEEIITTLPYPDSFQNSVPLLSLLALSIPMTTFLMLLGTVAIAVDRQRAWALALAGTVLLNVLLNLVAIPYFQQAYGNGGIGAALATLVCEALMVVMGVWLMPKGVVDRGMTINLLKVGLAGGVMVAIGYLIRGWGLGTVPLVLVTGFSYLALVLALRAVTVGEVRFIYGAVVARLKRTRVVPA